MLRYTLILPDGDAALAGTLLQGAIDDLNVVMMLVLGKDDGASHRIETIVGWADQLCEKTQVTPDYNLRRVVWIRKPAVQAVGDILSALQDPAGAHPLAAPSLPLVAVLNFHDQVRATLSAQDTIDPMALELAFLKGHG